jgi:hypothetical protein
MQKVEGSNPFIRSTRSPAPAGLLSSSRERVRCSTQYVYATATRSGAGHEKGPAGAGPLSSCMRRSHYGWVNVASKARSRFIELSQAGSVHQYSSPASLLNQNVPPAYAFAPGR